MKSEWLKRFKPEACVAIGLCEIYPEASIDKIAASAKIERSALRYVLKVSGVYRPKRGEILKKQRETREYISKLLKQVPKLSIKEIAEITGVGASTVYTVRKSERAKGVV